MPKEDRVRVAIVARGIAYDHEPVSGFDEAALEQECLSCGDGLCRG